MNGYVGSAMCVDDTSQAGSHPSGASPYGALDMVGNVYEWVSDWWSSTYYGSLSYFINPTGPGTGTDKTFRGGSFDVDNLELRTALRYGIDPGYRYDNFGFRCAASLAP